MPRYFLIPMTRTFTPREMWRPKYIRLEPAFSDLGYRSHGNARWFMLCEIRLNAGGDARQIDALALKPDVVEMNPKDAGPVGPSIKNAVDLMAADAGVALAPHSTSGDMFRAMFNAIHVKQRAETDQSRIADRAAYLVKLDGA